MSHSQLTHLLRWKPVILTWNPLICAQINAHFKWSEWLFNTYSIRYIRIHNAIDLVCKGGGLDHYLFPILGNELYNARFASGITHTSIGSVLFTLLFWESFHSTTLNSIFPRCYVTEYWSLLKSPLFSGCYSCQYRSVQVSEIWHVQALSARFDCILE